MFFKWFFKTWVAAETASCRDGVRRRSQLFNACNAGGSDYFNFCDLAYVLSGTEK